MSTAENLYLRHILKILFTLGIIMGSISFWYSSKAKTIGTGFISYIVNAYSKILSLAIASHSILMIMWGYYYAKDLRMTILCLTLALYATIALCFSVSNIVKAKFLVQLVKLFQIVCSDVQKLTNIEKCFSLDYAFMFRYKYYFYIVYLFEVLIEIIIMPIEYYFLYTSLVMIICLVQFIGLQVSNIIILTLLKNLTSYLKAISDKNRKYKRNDLSKVCKIIRNLFEIIDCTQRCFEIYVFCCYMSLLSVYIAVYYILSGLLCPDTRIYLHVFTCSRFLFRHVYCFFDLLHISMLTDSIFVEYENLVETVLITYRMAPLCKKVDTILLQYQLLRDVKFINAFGLFRIDRNFTFDYFVSVCRHSIIILQYFLGMKFMNIHVACWKSRPTDEGVHFENRTS